MSSRMRVTKGHRNNRRAHHGIADAQLTTEGDTKVPHIRHRANPVTGTYRGRKVIDVDAKLAKKAAKNAENTQEEEKA
jgi:ribosomal protein L32